MTELKDLLRIIGQALVAAADAETPPQKTSKSAPRAPEQDPLDKFDEPTASTTPKRRGRPAAQAPAEPDDDFDEAPRRNATPSYKDMDDAYNDFTALKEKVAKEDIKAMLKKDFGKDKIWDLQGDEVNEFMAKLQKMAN